MRLNIAVISGGSGNDALVKGIKSLYKEANIKVIVNAYDNGKSTGICRSVTNTLGVSDIRKNHFRMYKATCETLNQNLYEFYEKRYDFNKNKIIEEICNKLVKWNLPQFIIYVKNFFANEKAFDYEYIDFSVANIVYSEMYKEKGYEETNKYFCDLLGIDDFVLLNSFDNVFIHGVTESGNVIDDEGKLVEYKNPNDHIMKLKYIGDKNNNINLKALKCIEESDLIIISTGTFWSSIYPTLDYANFYKYINKSKAVKIWAMNNEEDKDSYGVSSNEFITIFNNLGLNLKDFIILENLDAVASLRQKNINYHIAYRPMDNKNGKHNGDKFALEILRAYYNLSTLNKYDNILLDFDDTIWSRDADTDHNKMLLSLDNLNLVSQLNKKAIIISGNNYESIKNKLYKSLQTDDLGIDIWADANSTLFSKGKVTKFIEDLKINGDYNLLIHYLNERYKINASINSFDRPACIKIKPLSQLDRELLFDLLPTILTKCKIKDYKVLKTGRTTIDIVHKDNCKTKIFKCLNLKTKNTLYIGDEIDKGNDKEIANLCTESIHVKDIKEVNLILKLLLKNCCL